MARTRGSGSIYKQRTSRVLWVKYYRNGRYFRESTHTTDRAKAKKFLSQRLAEIATGTFNGLEVERITIVDLADGFLRDYRVNGRRSLDDVEARWRLHLQPFFGSIGRPTSPVISSPATSMIVSSREPQVPPSTVNWPR